MLRLLESWIFGADQSLHTIDASRGTKSQRLPEDVSSKDKHAKLETVIACGSGDEEECACDSYRED
jgi:hypothetical protein